MNLAIGLVVKGGKEFIDEWIKSATLISDNWYIVDNGADEGIREKFLKCPQVKRYLYQPNLKRNMSRDYQKVLDMAREDDCTWIWNMDIDEIVYKYNRRQVEFYLLNSKETSHGVILFELRNDLKHYVMVKDFDGTEKHARLCHKIYKIQSHFEFNPLDWHGQSIPHNCIPGETLNVFVLHMGHMNKKMRDDKRKAYEELYKKSNNLKDKHESTSSTWFEEDESKIIIKEVIDIDKLSIGDK